MAEQSIMDEILAEPIPGEEGAATTTSAPPLAQAHTPEQMAFTGAMVGSNIPPGSLIPPTRGLQTAVGAGAGHFVGKTIQDLANDVPQNLNQIGDNLIEAGKQGMLSGSAEMLFPGLGSLATMTGAKRGAEIVGGAIAKKVGEYVLPVVGSVVQKAEKIVGKGGGPGLTPGQMVEGSGADHRALQIGENLAYHSWTGGPIRGVYEANERAAGQAVDSFVQQMEKLSPKDAEATFKEVISGRIKDLWMRPADRAFDSLRTRAQGNTVDVVPIVKLLRDPNSKIGNLVVDGLRKIREVKPGQAGEIDGLINLLKTPVKGTKTQALPKLTLNQALYLKAELNRIAGRTSYAGSPEGDLMISAAGRLNRQVDDRIKDGLAKQSQLTNDPRLVADYDKANKFYAAAASKYDNDLINKVFQTIEKKPGSLARVLLPDNIPSELEHLNIIKAAKAAYGPRWNIEMIPLLTASLANRAYNTVENRYSGTLLANQLGKYGQTLLDTMLGPKKGEQLMDFARTLELVGNRPKGTGSVAIQMMTAGSVAGAADYLISGDVEKALGSGLAFVTLAPWMTGHLLANPTWLKAMKTGLMEFHQTGKPPSMLMTTLRQAAAASQGGTVSQKLAVEPDRSKAISETALPTRTLTPEARPQ